MAAREMRRNWFNELLEDHKFSCYATAHHLDDQTETFFINLFRGTGIAGIHGILPKVGNLIHPMMYTWKKEIIRYARIKRIPYRLDKSNLTTDYERNAIRNVLLPAIREIAPGFDNTLNQNIQLFRKVEKIYRQRISDVAKKIMTIADDRVSINIPELEKLQDTSLYLFEILSEFNFSWAVVNDIYRSLSAESGKLFQSYTHKLVINRDMLIVEKKTEDNNGYSVYEIQESDLELTDPFLLRIKKYTRTRNTILAQKATTAMIDASKLTYPLRIRKWIKGDSFRPLGMTNMKLLSDYFIDEKFSIFDKERTWLLLSDDKIAWVIGHRIDDRFKITGQTKEIVEFNVVME